MCFMLYAALQLAEHEVRVCLHIWCTEDCYICASEAGAACMLIHCIMRHTT
jgi:hypothetical protein